MLMRASKLGLKKDRLPIKWRETRSSLIIYLSGHERAWPTVFKTSLEGSLLEAAEASKIIKVLYLGN